MSKHIVITGDSWTIYYDEFREPQPALEPALKRLGYTVTNLAVPGSSNDQAISRLEQYTGTADIAVFIQTEPVREYIDPSTAESSTPRIEAAQLLKIALKHGSLIKGLELQLAQDYQRLRHWSFKTTVPVLMIGGCSKVITSLVPDPLITAVPSISEFLLPGFVDNIFQNTNQWMAHDYPYLLRQNKLDDLLQEWYGFTELYQLKYQAWQADQIYFYPDKWHPNQLAHDKLADVIHTVIKDTDS